MKQCIVYIGDFDFRNENVQSHLVINNSKIFNRLGYDVFFIGIDRNNTNFHYIEEIQSTDAYLELPNTLSFKGLFKCGTIIRKIIFQLDELKRNNEISHVITYQSPTFASALKRIAVWCKNNGIKYLVNCADLPGFDAQPFIKRVAMKCNWNRIHKYNNKYADGIVAVSRYIDDFYHKDGRKSVIIPPLFDSNSYSVTIKKRDKRTSFVYAGTPFIKTIGPINPKGMKDRLDLVLDLFIDLAEKGIDYLFTIVGISLNDYLAAVPRHKTMFENNNRIIFLGRVSHSETLDLIAESDFSINYRDSNEMNNAGFSTKIVESISMGTPVVINSIGDTFHYIQEGIFGFKLSGKEKQDLALMTSLCLMSEQKRYELKTLCYSQNPFDCEKFVQLMRDFLQSLEC